jgi:hypothetical protein
MQIRARDPIALAFAIMLSLASAATANDLSPPRDDWFAPRVVFFTDYFLFSAEQEVMAMTDYERVALRKLLETCADTSIPAEIPRLRCDLATQQYLINYRQSRIIDHLLDAVQFMTSLLQYNRAIGRESEAGIDGRVGAIREGLATAVRLAPIEDDVPEN